MLTFFSALIQVNEDLKTIGALAGLAAVPGLAVLSLLYFGQAREVRRLREWAGRAPERAAELEQRVSAEAARRLQTVPRPGTQPATSAAQAATAAPAKPGGNGVAKPGAPAAQPATVAAQAAGAAAPATKPEEGKPAEGEKKTDAPPAEGDKKPEPPASDEAAKADGAQPEKKPEGPEGKPEEAKPDGAADKPAVPVKPTAATAAAAAAGGAAALPPRPRPAAPPVPPRPPQPAQPARASMPSATIPPRRSPLLEDPPPRRGRPSRGVLLGIGAALLGLLVVVALVVALTGGDDSTPAPSPNTVADAPATGAGAAGGAASGTSRAERAQTNVATLNGTTVTGLARNVANRLEEQGYTSGTVTDAANQAQPQTKVEYADGHRDEARVVAQVIKVPNERVVPLSPDDATTAGPNAEVVVIVGQDAAR